MIDEEGKGFQIEETDRGVEYRLPAILIGPARWWISLGIVGLGVGFLFHGGFEIASSWVVAKPGSPRAADWVFVAMGLWMVVGHLWFIFGRSEIVLDERFLTAIVRIGPFRWRRRVRRERVRRFTVVARGKGAGALGWSLPEGSSILRAELDRGKSLTLARLHPHELLRALADTLARRSALVAIESDDGFGDAVAKVKVAEDSEDPQHVRERPTQPARSNAVLERFDDGIEITFPREGFSTLWGTSLWVLVVTIFTTGVFVSDPLGRAAIVGNRVGFSHLLSILPFLALGIGLLLWTIHTGLRTVRITLRDGSLTIDRRGLFGCKNQSWPIDAVKSIVVRVHRQEDESGPSWSNDLGIELKGSTPEGLLAYRRKDESEWIATTLREAMGSTAGARERTEGVPTDSGGSPGSSDRDEFPDRNPVRSR